MFVKQNPITILLRDLMDGEDGWGTPAGRRLYDRLLRQVEQHPGGEVFRVSLRGVRRTDASFPREGFMELARRFRGKTTFFLTDADNQDLLENWDAAARKTEQPVLVLTEDNFQLLGPALSEGMRPLFELVFASSGITTAEAAAKLNQSIPNVSNKMKALWECGYIMRAENVAASGGIEFEYYVAR